MAIDRDTQNRKLAEMIAKTIRQRNRFITSAESERLKNALTTLNHRVPVFAHQELSDILAPEDYNRIFDLINVDHSIMMEDVRLLFEGINDLYALLSQKYVEPRLLLKKTVNKTDSFIRIMRDARDYNLRFQEDMNSSINLSSNQSLLKVDQTSGTLRLPASSERLYFREEDLKIDFKIITEKAHLIETTPARCLLEEGLTFYSFAYIERAENPEEFKSFDGAVGVLTLILPSNSPVNVIRLRQVSDAKQRILKIVYTQTAVETDEGENISEYVIAQNGFVQEVEFSTVQAKTIRIYVGTQLFEEVKTKTVIGTKTNPDFIKIMEQELRKIQIERIEDGFPLDAETIKKRVKEAAVIPGVELKPGGKTYAFAFRGVEVIQRQYSVFGEYSSQSRKFDGNLAYVTLRSHEIASDFVRTVYSLIINGKSYNIVPIDQNRVVRDIAVVRRDNLTDPLRRYYFETNVIPDRNFPVRIFLANSEVDQSNINYALTEGLPNGDKCYLSQSSTIVDGTTLVLEYTAARYDRNGAEYDPSRLDIINSIGKPNTRKYTYANRSTPYLYIYDADGKLSVYHKDKIHWEAAGTFFIKEADINGENWDLAGPTPLATKITTASGVVYRVLTRYFGLHDGGYLYQEDKGLNAVSHVVTTVYPYVKGMVVVSQNGIQIPVQSYYSSVFDTLASQSFQKITLTPGTYDPGQPVDVIYHPIPAADATLPNTVENNVNTHNISFERDLKNSISEINLERYPFVDRSIVGSRRFVQSNGLWYFVERDSIIYEPFQVYVEGRKLEYLKDFKNVGLKLTFTNPILGHVLIKHYSMADNLGFKIAMYSMDPTVNDSTTRITDIYALAKGVA